MSLTSAILAQAKQLSGAEDAALEQLCRAAELQLTGKLRKGLSPEDCGEAFILGAAMMAVSDYRELQYGGVAAFSAGDISITQAKTRTDTLRRAAEGLLAPYSEDSICFLRV